MSLLSSTELTKVLAAIELLNSGTGMDSLAERTLNCVSHLIPNEMAVFDGFDPSGEYSGYHWYSPPGAMKEDWIKALMELIHEHPVHQQIVTKGKETTFRITEFLSLKEYQRTPLYNEVYRNIGGDSQMGAAMVISPTSYVTHSLYRQKMDFTEQEGEMLRLVVPHLKNAFRNAQAFEQLYRQQKYLSTASRAGLVVLDAAGEILFINDRAQRMIGKYFDRLLSNGLPVEIIDHLKTESARNHGQNYFTPASPFTVTKQSDELRVQISIDSREREVTLLFEEKVEKKPCDLKPLGLTDREAEVLYWISMGKTDSEIAFLCSISPRTVHKHTENIFVKLGVETRTAAARRALESVY